MAPGGRAAPMRSILLAALAMALLAGCFTPREGSESTAPTSPTTVPSGPIGTSSTGCTSNASVGAGNGDIGADHACANSTSPTAGANGTI